MIQNLIMYLTCCKWQRLVEITLLTFFIINTSGASRENLHRSVRAMMIQGIHFVFDIQLISEYITFGGIGLKMDCN